MDDKKIEQAGVDILHLLFSRGFSNIESATVLADLSCHALAIGLLSAGFTHQERMELASTFVHGVENRLLGLFDKIPADADPLDLLRDLLSK